MKGLDYCLPHGFTFSAANAGAAAVNLLAPHPVINFLFGKDPKPFLR